MAFSERLALIITASADQAIREVTKVGATAERELGKATSSSEKFASSSLKIGAGLVAGGGVALTALARLGQGASAVNEQIAGGTVVFREQAKEVETWSRGLASSFGIAQRTALTFSNNFGSMFVGLGIARDEAADMSRTLIELSADLASFKDIAGGPEEVLERLRSGLAGEAEPLRNLGIFLNEAAVGAKAMELGIAGAGDKLTEAQKIQARYALILEQSSLAQGDFARTSDSLANSQRTAAAEAENAKNAFGQGVVGPMTAATKAIGGTVRALGELSPEIASTVGTIATIGAATAVGVGGLALLAGGAVKAKAALAGAEGGLNNFGRAARGLGVAGGAAAGLFALQGLLDAVQTSASEAAAEMERVSDAKLVETFKDLAPKDEFFDKLLDAVQLGRGLRDTMERVNDQQAEFFDALPIEQAQRLVTALKEAGVETGDLEDKLRARAKAEAEGASSTDKAKAALAELTGATEDSTEATEDDTKAQQERERAIRDVLAATEDLIGSQLSVADGTRRLNDASADSAQKERDLAAAIREHGRGSTEAAAASNDLEAARRDELRAIDDLAQASRDYAVQQAAAAGQTLSDADKYRIYRDELIKLKDQLAPGSPLRVHLEGLINQLPPPEVKFKVVADTQQATAALDALLAKFKEVSTTQPAGGLGIFVSEPTPTRKHAGGPIDGPGDEVPVLAQRGEYMVRREAVRKIGLPALERLNRMHTGGPVAGPAPAADPAGITPLAPAAAPVIDYDRLAAAIAAAVPATHSKKVDNHFGPIYGLTLAEVEAAADRKARLAALGGE